MEYNEVFVAQTDEINEGELKKFSADGTDVLLNKTGGKISATGAYCTHYGAPLETGVLSGDRIVCPWHHACFHAKTGDLQEPPARDSLVRFETRIDGNKVFVKIPAQFDEHRIPEMAKKDLTADNRTFVILGAGAAGNSAAQTLREDGFKGNVILVSRENRVPYDRPNLSKEYLQGEAEEEWMPLRDQNFYDDHDIECRFGREALSVDSGEKIIKLDDGSEVKFDKLLLATGGIPRTLDVNGSDLKNIFTLRSFDDADRIIETAEKSSKAVVIGSGFIGTEAAFSLRKRGLDVEIVTMDPVPFKNTFGEEIGRLFLKLHQDNGVKFHTSRQVDRFVGNGKVEKVLLDNGDEIETDMVLLAVGIKPATQFIQGIDKEADGSFKVDRYFKIRDDIYAAGDIVSFPDWHTGLPVRIEHWRTAEQHGRYAAHNMAEREMGFNSIPFFWTTQVDVHFRYVGHAADWDEIIVNGDISSRNFIAYYVKNNQVHAAAGIGRDQEMDAIEELMRMKNMPSPHDLRNEEVDLVDLLRS